jgi:hypothetical protein
VFSFCEKQPAPYEEAECCAPATPSAARIAPVTALTKRAKRAVGPEQLVDQRQNKQSICVRPDFDPFVGDCAIAGSHGIDGDELCASAAQARERLTLARWCVIVHGKPGFAVKALGPGM